jgi:transcriptional antiterminator NusG
MYDWENYNNWYAAFSLTGEEDKVKERIRYRLDDKMRVLVPKRRLRERKGGIWYDTIRTLFPGYILLNGDISVEDYYALKDIPGMIRLLSVGGKPLRIESHEIEIVNRLICNGETIGYSEVLVENGQVIVVDGPLVSLEGYISSIDRRKGRARVMLNFFGEERVVDLGISLLQPV